MIKEKNEEYKKYKIEEINNAVQNYFLKELQRENDNKICIKFFFNEKSDDDDIDISYEIRNSENYSILFSNKKMIRIKRYYIQSYKSSKFSFISNL